MKGLVAFPEELSRSNTHPFTHSEENCDFNRPHLFVLAILMTL